MKLIVSGSRSVLDRAKIFTTLDAFTSRQKEPLEIVCGMAHGPDMIGREWATKNNVPVKEFPADWRNLTAPGARIKDLPDGTKYNCKAGLERNFRMAQYADAAICFWDGRSFGTKNMIEIMRNKFKKPVTVIYTDNTRPPRKLKGEAGLTSSRSGRNLPL
jgi:hypothetical protein